MKKIIFASYNQGKIKEIKDLFAKNRIDVITPSDLGIEDVEENGLSFVENAILKARHCAKHSKLPALADDSGLVVYALSGQPGIYSARYSNGGSKENIKKLLKNIKGEVNRKAKFVCSLVFMRSEIDPVPMIFYGELSGEIAKNENGTGGFGYDPVFYLPEYQKTMAMITSEEKNKISHRAKALFQFKKALNLK